MLDTEQRTQALGSESVLFHLTRDLWSLSLEWSAVLWGKTKEGTVLILLDLLEEVWSEKGNGQGKQSQGMGAGHRGSSPCSAINPEQSSSWLNLGSSSSFSEPCFLHLLEGSLDLLRSQICSSPNIGYIIILSSRRDIFWVSVMCQGLYVYFSNINNNYTIK